MLCAVAPTSIAFIYVLALLVTSCADIQYPRFGDDPPPPIAANDDPVSCVDARWRPLVRWKREQDAVVEKHVSVLDTCRDSRKAPVDMRFLVTFEADGRPATRLVANNLFDCTFAECVRERLDGLEFEAFTGRPSEQYYLGLSWRGKRPPVVGLNRPLGDKPTERYCVEERHAK
jgi:hypothetical protein